MKYEYYSDVFLESPCLSTNNQYLIAINILSPLLFILNLKTFELKTIDMPFIVYKIFNNQDHYIIASDDALYTFYLESKKIKKLKTFDFDSQFQRLNDGLLINQNSIFIGTITHDRNPFGLLYHYYHNKIYIVRRNVHNSNGMVYDRIKKTIYYIDSNLKRIDSYYYEQDKPYISSPNIFYQWEDAIAKPDGMSIDDKGNLYVCMIYGERIDIINSSGQLSKSILLKDKNPTSCLYYQKHLYITLGKKDSYKGGLLVLPVNS